MRGYLKALSEVAAVKFCAGFFCLLVITGAWSPAVMGATPQYTVPGGGVPSLVVAVLNARLAQNARAFVDRCHDFF